MNKFNYEKLFQYGKDKTKYKKLDFNPPKKSKINTNQIFIDTSTTSSIPLTPSKKESKSIILTRKDGKNTIAKEIPISQIPLVSSMSKVMNILRVYTPASYRKKVEIATKSIQREMK